MVDRHDIDALLIGSLYGELSSADEARLRAHLESHPADRTALDGLTRARHAVRASRIFEVQLEPSQAVSALLLQEAARRAPRKARTEEREGWFVRLRRSFLMHPAMAAAAMLVVVVGVAGTLYMRQGDHFAAPVVSPVGPGIPSRRTFEPWLYDPRKAKALLAEAGYPNGFSMTVWSPHGRYLKDAETAEAVVSYFKDVGIDASLKIWEWSPYVDAALQKPSPTKAMDIALLGRATMGADFWMQRLWSSQSGGNVTGYNNPRVDQLLEAGRQTFNKAEADRIYGEVQQIVFKDDVPFIFLHHQTQVLGVRKGVTGLYAYPEEFLDLFSVRKA